MCSDTQAKHLDLLPESMMEALLVKHYTVRPINLKMFCTSDFCAACTRVCVCAWVGVVVFWGMTFPRIKVSVAGVAEVTPVRSRVLLTSASRKTKPLRTAPGFLLSFYFTKFYVPPKLY